MSKLYSQQRMKLFKTNTSISHIRIAEQYINETHGENFIKKISGKFYTPKEIAFPLIEQTIKVLERQGKNQQIKIIDPFCGDGRLLKWFIEKAKIPFSNLEVHLWDYDEEALIEAYSQISNISKKIKIYWKKVDTFSEFIKEGNGNFDLVITNPPWEMVKPDPKEIAHIVNNENKEQYIRSLKEFSNRLEKDFPLSKPLKSYGGWGMHLARVGTELSLRLAKQGGIVSIVTPASILADQNSYKIRKWLFEENSIKNLNIYPAELKVFSGVDQSSISFILERGGRQDKLEITNCETMSKPTNFVLNNVEDFLKSTGYTFPISIAIGRAQLEILTSLKDLPRLSDLEGNEQLWIGRELDETRHKSWLTFKGTNRFIKGRDITRFSIDKETNNFINNEKLNKKIPNSVNYDRIIWRDVSRSTQKRRLIATIIPPTYVTGNSLGILHTGINKDNSHLLALLGLISSFIFEFQLRGYLATSHVSAGIIRNIRVPKLGKEHMKTLSRMVEERLNGNLSIENEIEVFIAKSYGLNKSLFNEILNAFPKLSRKDKEGLLDFNLWNQ